MTIHQQFQQIKRLFFPCWDRQNVWRISTRSRRNVHGYCDVKRRVIEIVVQHADQDYQDKLMIHEICHAVAAGGHGKVWQRRMEKAVTKADQLGRTRLAELLRQEIVDYQEVAVGVAQAYQTVEDWIAHKPDLMLVQVKWSLADEYGLLMSEVGMTFKRIKKVYEAARREALEARAMRDAWLKEGQRDVRVRLM